jgi:tetratricopeptide (TPR) repeat protein
MKTLIVGTVLVCIAGGSALCLYKAGSRPHTQPQLSSQEDTGPSEAAPALAPSSHNRTEPLATNSSAEQEATQSAKISITPALQSKPTPSPALQLALETLLSPQATFDQKQAVWQQLKDSGKLDLAITELEQRAANNPTRAEYPAALGQACLQKAAMLKDIREQGILGMKADQNFDAALSLDPANWEAGFWKAAAMSYWPPQLNKGQEVLERFAELIKLQETQPVQPQFAQTYVLLGEQYQKQGYNDYARQIWERGGALFPSDAKLLEKLSQPRPEQAAAH